MTHAPLPLLRAGAVILLRPGGRIQVGFDPDRAVIIDPPAHVAPDRLTALLRSLTGPQTSEDTAARAAAAGLSVDEIRELLDQLVDAGIAHHSRAVLTPMRIRVHGAGPLADAVTTALSGPEFSVRQSVRRPRLFDGEVDPITHEDRMVTWATDLVILTDFLAHDPWLVSSLMRHRIPHLMVRLRDGTGVIGPMVLPGLSSCLHCADHHRRDRDRDWPIVSAQLLGQSGWAGSATIAGTAAIVQGEVEHIAAATRPDRRETGDLPAPASLDATIEFRADPSALVIRGWSPHPLCGCRLPE
ncbi:hypothetical protein [Nocardia sp. 348MFTsu5.1]|uniref:hypothetical protein n=1 Tax=Nocardia sp. 348MFTsu5.1 TaxID=1172185 RepID=UPI0005693256|nr:hypothetical protein [Nocardia sp. 348MFTsu5.1]